MAPLTKIRLCLVIVMAGLFVAGITAFPLLAEVNWLSQLLVGTGGSLDPALYDGVTQWILTVRQGLEVTYLDYPWLAYGTDWLAYGHLMILLFFIVFCHTLVWNVRVLLGEYFVPWALKL